MTTYQLHRRLMLRPGFNILPTCAGLMNSELVESALTDFGQLRLIWLRLRAPIELLHRFGTASGGGVALLTALAAPPILLVALGAIQLQSVVSDRQQTQDIADASALWGAQQLRVAPVGVEERTTAFANAQLETIRANATVTVSSVITTDKGVRVTIDTTRPSFFLNLLPLNGFQTHAVAEAEGAAQSPLCVVSTGSAKGDDLLMTKNAKLQAPACLVHSNMNVTASGGGLIQASVVEASGSASGPISPAASTGAPTIDDPFTAVPIDTSECAGKAPKLKIGDGVVVTLAPGLHVEDFDIKNGGTLKLYPGNHIFCASIKLSAKGNISGDDVVLLLDEKVKLDWKDGGNVSLNGRTSGALAGFVIISSRVGKGDFEINSDPITNITGAIYVPNAGLKIDGSKRAGASSDWTVVVAKSIEARDSANLVINADYASSSVPVPSGTGNRIGMSRLVR